MEPISATWIVGLLALHAQRLAAHAVSAVTDEVSDLATERLKALVAAVRRHFRDDPGTTDALERLDRAPDDERRRGAVEERLEEALAADPGFTQTLTRLAADIAAVAERSTTITDAGAVAVNGNVSVTGGGHAAGRDVIIGSDPEHGRAS